MDNYQELIRFVRDNGEKKGDRTGTGTTAIFGAQQRFDLENSFPLITTKKIHFKSVVHELLWFLSGGTNIDYLNENGVRIWDQWADEGGEVGPIYGKQWRKWDANYKMGEIEIDQLGQVIANINNQPTSRRHLVSAWNVGHLDKMGLPPCHSFYQFYVNNGRISCQVYMRSVDLFLGYPFDIASYALLTKMVGQVTANKPKELIFALGDTHIYDNHQEQVEELLSREPRPLPQVTLNERIQVIDDFKFEDVTLIGYNPHPPIKAPVAV